VAESVHATDHFAGNDRAGGNARPRRGRRQPSASDAFNLPAAWKVDYTAVFAAGLWSHVKREDQEKYLKTLRAKLGKDVLLVLLDESYVDGNSMVFARTDLEGNTFQILTADDGQRYEIMKNYLTDSTLRKRFSASTRQIRVERLEYYYLLSCRLK
jgi:hypothetical protein